MGRVQIVRDGGVRMKVNNRASLTVDLENSDIKLLITNLFRFTGLKPPKNR